MEIFHDDNTTTTVESQRLNSIQESEYTNQISFCFICIFFFFSTNEKLDLFLSDSCMSVLEIFENWRVNKNIVAYEKLYSKSIVNVAMSDWRSDPLKK